MKLVILGAGGMAGHVLYRYFQKRDDDHVWGTTRTPQISQDMICLDVIDESRVLNVIERIQPDVIINAVGLLNDDAAQHVKQAIYVNALFPHVLTDIGEQVGCKIVHISTDCVFSGRIGNYKEVDITDGVSAYAKTKSLGEVVDGRNLTIRTSIIGPEIKTNGIGLFHWFCHQKGQVKGFSRVYWNGVTTLELAKAIEWSIHHNTTGLVHLTAPNKISKYQLLAMFKDIFERDDIEIVPDAGPQSDKTLVNTRTDFTFTVHSYQEMIEEMKDWMR